MIKSLRKTDLRKPSVKHVHEDGARFHVLSWDDFGEHCSQPQCEKNFERAERIRKKRDAWL